MIAYKVDKSRHCFTMSKDDLASFAQLIWHLKHDPPLIGFNRNTMPVKQRAVVEAFYDHIEYPENYGELLNANGL